MTETWFLRDLPGVAHGPGVRRALSLEPGGEVGWTPLELPQLALWISPRGTGTLRGEPSGDPFTGSFAAGYAELIGNGDTAVFVSQADDLSGGGHHAVQTTAANQPELVHDGTRLVFRYAGSQWFIIPVATGLGPSMADNPYTLLVGAWLTEELPSGAERYLFSTEKTEGDDLGARLHNGHRNGTEFTIGHWSNDANFARAKDQDRHIFTSQYHDPGSTLRIDGAQVGSTNTGDPHTLERNGDVFICSLWGQASFWVGDATDHIFCCGHADAELGTSDIEQAEAYIDAAGELGVL